MRGAMIDNLIIQWNAKAQYDFLTARVEHDRDMVMILEHGATCYFNCAQELMEILTTKVGDSTDIQTLAALADKWDRLVERKLSDAEHEPNLTGQDLICHGAMCYSNCAVALRTALLLLA
jgi:hypothetical protein